MTTNLDISQIFKTEYRNIVSVLCHYYGIENIQLAEDIVSDTFVSAMKSWSHNGIPSQPKAWLRKSAVNKLTDHFRRQKTYAEKVLPAVENDTVSISPVFSEEIIQDSQLRMIFAICDPSLKADAQICMALRILCGLNIDEIAKALLSNKDAINKKLYRAKKSLKEKSDFNTELDHSAYQGRIDNVLRVIYLLFNEGYYSSVKEENLRQDICWEAMRLTLFLTKHEFLPLPRIHGLFALMCFHASRFGARTDQDGHILLLEEQDRSKWDAQLISKGEFFLNKSAEGKVVSKYHLEAAIAYWHTTEVDEKWQNILQLYNKLLLIEYSPLIALNRTYALARAQSPEIALNEALKLDLPDNHLYYALLAELYRMNGNQQKEIEFLNTAMNLTKKASDQELLKKKLQKAQGIL